jgi:8-amino-7-oxononanoate synthase
MRARRVSSEIERPNASAIDAALDLVSGMDDERSYAARLAERFRTGARDLGLDTGNSKTQIVPVILGSPEFAIALSDRLKRAGLWASAIRPPTVPAGTARLRIAFTAAHEESDLTRLLEVLAAADARTPAGAM